MQLSLLLVGRPEAGIELLRMTSYSIFSSDETRIVAVDNMHVTTVLGTL